MVTASNFIGWPVAAYPRTKNAQTKRCCRKGCGGAMNKQSVRSPLIAKSGSSFTCISILLSSRSLSCFSASVHIMLARLSLFILFLCHKSIIADRTCYWPDDSVIPNSFDHTPCKSTAAGGDSACCSSAEPCSANGYCFGTAGFVHRGGCTDINCPSCRNGTNFIAP